MTAPPREDSSELAPADQTRLGENLARVRQRIASACERAGRDPAEVGLVTVTKYSGPALARGLLALGQQDFGENRVDHLRAQAEALATAQPRPRWHFVGHLQRNKAKHVADTIDVLHSLDRLELLEKLVSRRAPDASPLDVYVQLRLDAGDQRSGLDEDGVVELAKQAVGLTSVRLVGLMGLPPVGAPEEARPHFRRLAALRDRMLEAGLTGPLGLSMGMTSDLEVAIEEGSTCVRVGRALLEGIEG